MCLPFHVVVHEKMKFCNESSFLECIENERLRYFRFNVSTFTNFFIYLILILRLWSVSKYCYFKSTWPRIIGVTESLVWSIAACSSHQVIDQSSWLECPVFQPPEGNMELIVVPQKASICQDCRVKHIAVPGPEYELMTIIYQRNRYESLPFFKLDIIDLYMRAVTAPAWQNNYLFIVQSSRAEIAEKK